MSFYTYFSGINHTPNKPWNKNNKISFIFSQKSNSFSKKPQNRKIESKTLPIIVENASTALPAIVLRASGSFLNQFFKALLSFAGNDPNMPVIACGTSEMVKEKAVSVDTIPAKENI